VYANGKAEEVMGTAMKVSGASRLRRKVQGAGAEELHRRAACS
jgi:hypothetical protein